MLIAKLAPARAAADVPDAPDLVAYREPGFEFDVNPLVSVQGQLDGVRPDDGGVRWVHEPGVVSFYAVRDVDAPYDAFIDQIDIAAVGRMFRAVRDSETEVIRRDDRGRVQLQLERMAVLAQPGHSAYMAKRNLVYTVERMDYGAHEHRVWMRTVHGPSSSDLCEDGYLAIRRRPDGGTRIALLSRQQFPSSSLLALAGLDRCTWLKKRLSVNAFRCFFHRTTVAIEAGYAGPRLGLTH